MTRPFIVACIPAYNEEKRIARVVVDTLNHVDQVIVCDDASQDMTAKIAEKLGAVVISHKRNLGYGAAISSLFGKALEMRADIIVTIDADGQHNPTEIPSIIQPIIDGHAEVVIGSRFMGTNDDNVQSNDTMSSYRKFGVKTITKISNIVSQNNLTDSQSGFRAYHKRVIGSISVTEQGMGASTEIIFKAQSAGFKIVEVPIRVTYDEDSSTHNSVSHGIDVAMSTFKFISIEHPLRFYGIPGIICIGLSLFFGIWALQLYAAEGRLVTNITLVSLGFLMPGLVLLTTSVILYVVINVVREIRRV